MFDNLFGSAQPLPLASIICAVMGVAAFVIFTFLQIKQAARGKTVLGYIGCGVVFIITMIGLLIYDFAGDLEDFMVMFIILNIPVILLLILTIVTNVRRKEV